MCCFNDSVCVEIALYTYLLKSFYFELTRCLIAEVICFGFSIGLDFSVMIVKFLFHINLTAAD